AEAEYWLQAGAQKVPRLPRDYEDGENLEASVAQAGARLSVTETRALLQEVPERYQTEITEILVLGLVEALWRWSGERLVRLALEGHGREEIGEAVEVTRTVGWFTSIYPAVIDLRQVYELGVMLQRVKEQLRQIPRRGIGYGALRYLGASEAVRQALREQAEPELSFNYLGQFDQAWLRDTSESGGAMRNPRGRRRYLLDVSSNVVDGQLQVTVLYSREIHRVERMTELVNQYMTQLRRIIEHCREQQAASYTPSDFPQARLSQAGLNKLLSRMSKAR
ncbi:MAG TPA: condensation domain-containing protein, partial [Pyrinomonadaceae bacterium]|nr:condensation domain-containing protein [Pyrinomonadaceae bacterium]